MVYFFINIIFFKKNLNFLRKEIFSANSPFDRKKETPNLENNSKSKFLGWSPAEDETLSKINNFCVCVIYFFNQN